MVSDPLIGFVLILGAAIWPTISVRRKAPDQKHSVVEYVDAFFFPEDDHEHQ